VDRVVGGDAQRTDRPRLEPVVDDLDARDQRVDVLGDRGRRVATVDWFDIDADAEGELGLDDAMRELVGRERRRRSARWSATSAGRTRVDRSAAQPARSRWCTPP
jgi:hypothetical protein